MRLSEYQALWDEVLLGTADPEIAAEKLGVVPERLALYRKFVRQHCRGVLEKMYPRIRKLQPEGQWAQWVEEYYQAYPPGHYELNQLTARFPDFLKARIDRGEVPDYLEDLARYEWEEFAAYSDPRMERVTLQPGQICLNPTARRLDLQYDLPAWVDLMDKGADCGLPKRQPVRLLIARSPETGACVFTKISPLAEVLVQVLSDGRRLPREELEQALCEALGECLGEDAREPVHAEVELLLRQSALLG